MVDAARGRKIEVGGMDDDLVPAVAHRKIDGKRLVPGLVRRVAGRMAAGGRFFPVDVNARSHLDGQRLEAEKPVRFRNVDPEPVGRNPVGRHARLPRTGHPDRLLLPGQFGRCGEIAAYQKPVGIKLPLAVQPDDPPFGKGPAGQIHRAAGRPDVLLCEAIQRDRQHDAVNNRHNGRRHRGGPPFPFQSAFPVPPCMAVISLYSAVVSGSGSRSSSSRTDRSSSSSSSATSGRTPPRESR